MRLESSLSLSVLSLPRASESSELTASLPVRPPAQEISVEMEVEEEGAAACPGFSCFSLMGDHSKHEPPDFSNEPGLSETQ